MSFTITIGSSNQQKNKQKNKQKDKQKDLFENLLKHIPLEQAGELITELLSQQEPMFLEFDIYEPDHEADGELKKVRTISFKTSVITIIGRPDEKGIRELHTTNGMFYQVKRGLPIHQTMEQILQK